MCGIAGFWGDGYNHNEASVILNEMGSSIAHRGPDDSGVFFDERSGLGLAHRRLSILIYLLREVSLWFPKMIDM